MPRSPPTVEGDTGGGADRRDDGAHLDGGEPATSSKSRSAGRRPVDRREDGGPVSSDAHAGPSEPVGDVGDRLGVVEGCSGADVVVLAVAVVVVDEHRQPGPVPGARPFEHLSVTAGVADGDDRLPTELRLEVLDLRG